MLIKDAQTAHSEMVHSLVKSGQSIINQLTPSKANLWHMATGICGEAGELIDAIKNAAIYNKPLDQANVMEELGDLEFYIEGVRQELGISREETLQHNLNKLAIRYKDYKYSDKQAQERKDKQ